MRLLTAWTSLLAKQASGHVNGRKTAGGGGRDLALRRLLPLAEEQVRALAVCHQEQQQSSHKRARTDDNEPAVDG